MSDSPPAIHPSAVVDAGARIGAGTRIWHFCHVMDGAEIGCDVVIGQGCFVAGRARIGDRVRLQNHVSVYEGVELEAEVFCGPGVVFTNVKNPRAAVPRKHEYKATLVRRGATLGANATLLPGVVVGRWAFVAAGAVVTHDVPDFALVVGAPARGVGHVSRNGQRLQFDADGVARCPATGELYRQTPGGVEPCEDDA